MRSSTFSSRSSRSFLAIVVAAAGIAFVGARQASAVTYAPSQIRTAYGVNGISFGATAATGAGTTIAIIDADNYSTIASDVATFNTTYGVPQFGVAGGPTLTVVGQTGGASPSTAATGSQALETALDVEYAHAIAPGANILLVQANSLQTNDLVAAINYAKTQANVSTISMSFGEGEYAQQTSAVPNGVNFDDATFSQMTHNVTFLASTGDSGTINYPATSPYVIAVGGTSLTLNANNTRNAETVWNNSSGSTGAGVSVYEPKPTYQQLAAAAFNGRVVPDVSWDGDPQTGVAVYSMGTTYSAGGTSASAPQWAGLIALANQGRAALGLAPLTTTSALTMLYALYGTPLYGQAFYDVTGGASNGYSAGTGFDAASGLGTPNANFIVPYLAGYIALPEPATASAIILAAAGLFGRRRPRAAIV